MWKYVVRRLIQIIPVLILISLACFALLINMPGDPINQMIFANPEITQEDIDNLRAIYGLDDPFLVRYSRWMNQTFIQRDLGYSRQYKTPVATLIRRRLPNTLWLTCTSFIIALGFAIPAGIYSAVRQYSAGDYFFTGFAFFGFSIPNHWLGLLLIYFFSVWLGWLPSGGFRSLVQSDSSWVQFWDRIYYLILPALTLGISSMASWMRYMRSSMLEVIREDYIRTARAKGLTGYVVVYKHALRNALLPIITLVMMAIPFIFSGAVITEAVFSFPGMGQLFLTSILNHDTFVTMTIVMFLAVMVVTFNLLADILYAMIDPRIRFD